MANRKVLAFGRIALLAITSSLGGVVAAGQMQAPVAPPRGHSLTRSIEGTVVTKEGAPIPGATVLLKDTKTLQVRSYIAKADGRYHFFGLSTDVNYELRAQANGMTSPVKTVSVFDSHNLVKLDLKMNKAMKK